MNNKNEFDILISLVSLGLSTALENDCVDIDDAQMLLFSPRMMILLGELNYSEELINIIHLGTELEDVKDNINHKYKYYCNDLSHKVINHLKKLKNLKEPPYIIENLLNKTKPEIKRPKD